LLLLVVGSLRSKIVFVFAKCLPNHSSFNNNNNHFTQMKSSDFDEDHYYYGHMFLTYIGQKVDGELPAV